MRANGFIGYYFGAVVRSFPSSWVSHITPPDVASAVSSLFAPKLDVEEPTGDQLTGD